MAKYQLSKEEIKQLQRLIGAEEDGLWGPKSKAALNEYTLSQFEPMTEPSTAEYNPLFNTARLPVNVDKPEPVADYREDKEPINYMDALLALKNLESNKPMPRVPSSWVGWASYINSGDRGLLSEFAEADKAWNMKKLEEEEKARQLISNIREKELDRKNAKEIAEQNRILGAADKLDELNKLRGKALVNLQYAEAAYKQAKAKGDQAAIDTASRDVQLAQEDLAYYNNRLGTKIEAPKSADNKGGKESETPVNLTVDLERYKAFTKGKKAERDAMLKEIEDNPNFKQSPELQREYQRISRIKSDEQLLEELNERRKEWEEGNKLTGYDYRKWKESPKGKKLIAEFGE